ncbi:MAG: hypothetical protein WHS64_08315 [Fervidobacterium sp.]|uniref:Uncharacterized protein n=1 Tax=Fervidobacterium gondwanense DSM 13020 TaxID=1121883 RepID=A0A1M7SYZ3_FERGO|nr:hypothetical protein [Fervidobacterium gondwanense]UXF01054.1 hypothetical protein IB67_05755 [Fervidobacterium riparium]SHN63637.1 hypothetical protein SAMN02745226_01366 [Fervidobacterium gondwanense DSM 13020]
MNLLDGVSTLVDKIVKNKVIAIIGIEKNTGKTETLNYIVSKIKHLRKVALTSIGTDGEEKDLVYGTLKPSVHVDLDFVYTTTDVFFKRKRILSEILHVSKEHTSTGRLIIARALEPGRVILSGPPSTDWMKRITRLLSAYADIVIIDGALSRFSQASPFIAEGIILATGAAYSLNKSEIIRHTRYVYSLCMLPEIEDSEYQMLSKAENIMVYSGGEWKDAKVQSALHLSKLREMDIKNIDRIYIPGALTDNVLKVLHDKEIIIQDFTKIFVSHETYTKYKPRIRVFKKANIIGITVNPFSPTGYMLNSEEIITELKKYIDIPIIDVRKVE